jgi:ribosomal-protein-alanine N-acetyltransferase
MIQTRRLELRPGTIAALEAELAGREYLAEALGAEIADNWPPPLYDEPAMRWTLEHLQSGDIRPEYGLYYFVDIAGERPVAVGVGGFKGDPDGGRVEIGYSVLPQFQRRGYASEAVAGFLEYAFSDARVREVIAETLPELTPSIGVLEKNGFAFVGNGSGEGVIRYRLKRDEWQNGGA